MCSPREARTAPPRLTQPADLDLVAKALGRLGLEVQRIPMVWKAKNPLTLPAEARAAVETFLSLPGRRR